MDHAVEEVFKEDVLVIIDHVQIAESSEALLKYANCAKACIVAFRISMGKQEGP